jgi:hypothetical protein
LEAAATIPEIVIPEEVAEGAAETRTPITANY